DDCCSAADRHEVLDNWKGIWSAEFTGRRVAIGQAIFQELFALDPNAKGVFGRVNVDKPSEADWKAHVIRVINGLDLAVNLLEDPKALQEELKHLARQHRERSGVKAVYFDEMEKALLKVLPQVSSHFNSGAWDRCFTRIADVIKAELP
uniref:Extracellular globin-2B n=1 Tax=Tylorrhynchus heterochetus TaxID=3228785 RepID=GLB3_TYLHE|nr:RecName: Full=Extracellular globin-2B; AltName: Full=Erythrocruorin; AltName: Full=Extracellular globin IIB [Tylorrhynchus heterochaetus]